MFFKDKDRKGYQFDEYETIDGDHGRIETRKYVITSDIDWLYDKENWPGLTSIGMVESVREIKGDLSHEKRYYISSLNYDARQFGKAVRSHWGIENCVHWVLDIAFREDESRIRKGSAPENIAAMDTEYLENVMFP